MFPGTIGSHLHAATRQCVIPNLKGIPSSTIFHHNAFSNVDFPAFTTPAIATVIPFFIPSGNESHNLPACSSSESNLMSNSPLSANPSSSLGKIQFQFHQGGQFQQPNRNRRVPAKRRRASGSRPVCGGPVFRGDRRPQPRPGPDPSAAGERHVARIPGPAITAPFSTRCAAGCPGCTAIRGTRFPRCLRR